MNDVTFKICPKGEGKTKWLLNIANEHVAVGRKVYLFTTSEVEYAKFCEKYFNTFKTACPVERLTAFKITKNDVVLIDNLFNHDAAISDVVYMKNNSYKMYVTVEGNVVNSNNDQMSLYEYAG